MVYNMSETTTVLEPTHVLTPFDRDDERFGAQIKFQTNIDDQGVRTHTVLDAPKISLASRVLLDQFPTYPEAMEDGHSVGWRENWLIHLPGYDYEIVGWINNPPISAENGEWVLERLDKENDEA